MMPELGATKAAHIIGGARDMHTPVMLPLEAVPLGESRTLSLFRS